MSDNWNPLYWQPDDDSFDLNAAHPLGEAVSWDGSLERQFTAARIACAVIRSKRDAQFAAAVVRRCGGYGAEFCGKQRAAVPGAATPNAAHARG